MSVLAGSAAVAGLAGCAADAPDAMQGMDASGGMANTGSPPPAAPAAPSFDDRADSILPVLSRIADLAAADPAEERMTYAPAVPKVATRTDQRIVEFSIDVLESECVLDPANNVSTMMWGFRIGGDDVECGSPGPVLRARVGDLARITVNNLATNANPHNIDFHAVTGQGGGAEATTVPPGESATINSRLLYPGTFMYHCAYGDVPLHISHGMYGMFIVDPETPLPVVDHEWSIMQSEWYLSEPSSTGMAMFDPDRLLLEHPTYVTFNGRTDALTGDNALQMAVGERARIYMINEGLNLISSFHPIGSQWDVVYPEAATHPSNRVIRGSQTTLVPAGGGTVTELVGHVPSTIILVDHALTRTFYKGCIGQIIVAGDPNAYFSEGEAGLADASANEPAAPPAQAANEVVIENGAYDPANAATAFLPSPMTVAVGTTVTWRNDDAVFHTVTSGTSNGTVGKPDGKFESGNIQKGETFSMTFDEAGTFDYFCTPHPWMRGQVVVTG
ncbi:MAG: plastocyanin/azurin family copper-binding protein [Ilumatobacteraceae bacterium]